MTTTTKSIGRSVSGLSAVPAIKFAQDRALAAGIEAARLTPLAAVLEGGVSVEKAVRNWLDAYRDQCARLAGVASRQEVRRLRELVRALEYRLECVEQGTDTQPARSRVKG